MIQKILLTATLALSFVFTSFAQDATTKEQTKENKKEACSDKFNIDESKILITNDKSVLSGYFMVRFDKGSDEPTSLKVIMEISDCKGTVSYISIPLTLDAKSGVWMGKGGLPHLPGCSYDEQAVTLVITNECDEVFKAEERNKQKSNIEDTRTFKKLKGSKSKGYDAY